MLEFMPDTNEMLPGILCDVSAKHILRPNEAMAIV